ncbi:MAG: hypothetical protein ACNA7J_12305, partial [Wenzhouxiangella sp.]
MNSSEEQRKSNYLESIESRIREDGGNDKAVDFARQLLQRIPSPELQSADVSEHAALARDFFEFVQQRRRHEVKIRTVNPERERDGWESSHTILEIINDDMPFLVDSVVLVLSELGLSAHLIIHPVMRVRRDEGGNWL